MQLPKILKDRKGFTLIELLVVIAVLGILAAVVLVAINPAQRLKSARDTGVKSDTGQIGTALETYYTNNNGVYPTDLSALTSSGELKRLPKQPDGYSVDCTGTTGGTVNDYQYATAPATGDVTEASVYCHIEAPKDTSKPYYCYKTIVGKAAAGDSTTCASPDSTAF